MPKSVKAAPPQQSNLHELWKKKPAKKDAPVKEEEPVSEDTPIVVHKDETTRRSETPDGEAESSKRKHVEEAGTRLLADARLVFVHLVFP